MIDCHRLVVMPGIGKGQSSEGHEESRRLGVMETGTEKPLPGSTVFFICLKTHSCGKHKMKATLLLQYAIDSFANFNVKFPTPYYIALKTASESVQ